MENGTFELEAAYLALTPGPTMRRYGIDGPDALAPVAWKGRLYLLEALEMTSFCRMARDGSLTGHATMYFYNRASSGENACGDPEIPAPCQTVRYGIEP